MVPEKIIYIALNAYLDILQIPQNDYKMKEILAHGADHIQFKDDMEYIIRELSKITTEGEKSELLYQISALKDRYVLCFDYDEYQDSFTTKLDLLTNELQNLILEPIMP